MLAVDALIITALKEEYEAARDAGQAEIAGNPGVKAWKDPDVPGPAPYILGEFVMAGRAPLSIALARPTRQGSNAAGVVAAGLSAHLTPRCLAMCGVCAGNPAEVALG